MLVLLLFLQVCHFLGDFTPLSTAWMLHAKQTGKPLLPILIHAGVHAILMFLVLLFFCDPVLSVKLMVLQWGAHFLIDTLKGRMNVWFPVFQDSTRRPYWMIFGIDQFLHQLTILSMVYLWSGA